MFIPICILVYCFHILSGYDFANYICFIASFALFSMFNITSPSSSSVMLSFLVINFVAPPLLSSSNSLIYHHICQLHLLEVVVASSCHCCHPRCRTKLHVRQVPLTSTSNTECVVTSIDYKDNILLRMKEYLIKTLV